MLGSDAAPPRPRLAAARVKATDARTDPTGGRVVVFGDSLIHEARTFLLRQLGGSVAVETHTFPLTAPPRVAVLEFSEVINRPWESTGCGVEHPPSVDPVVATNSRWWRRSWDRRDTSRRAA